MKKYVFLLILMLMITGCSSKLENKNDSYDNKDRGLVIINKDNLEVHSSFDLKSQTDSKVGQSQIFTVYDIKEDAESNKWYRISAEEDKWISGLFSSLVDMKSLLGMYEYRPFENDNSEDHTLVFEWVDNTLVGRYYGTSDDFDPVREGYTKGYYVVDLLDIMITEDKISFSLNPITSDMFTEKIALDIKNSQEAIARGFIPWQPGSNITDPMKYSGYFKEDSLTLEMLDGIRTFKKVMNE